MMYKSKRYNIKNNSLSQGVKVVDLAKMMKVPYDNRRKEDNRFFIVTKTMPNTKRKIYVIWDGWDDKISGFYYSEQKAKETLRQKNVRDPL